MLESITKPGGGCDSSLDIVKGGHCEDQRATNHKDGEGLHSFEIANKLEVIFGKNEKNRPGTKIN